MAGRGGGLSVWKCGKEMDYLFKWEATTLSMFGRVRYRRRYHSCGVCQVGQEAQDKRLGIAAGQVSAGLVELLALAGKR